MMEDKGTVVALDPLARKEKMLQERRIGRL